jgi:hypothetical protein
LSRQIAGEMSCYALVCCVIVRITCAERWESYA